MRTIFHLSRSISRNRRFAIGIFVMYSASSEQAVASDAILCGRAEAAAGKPCATAIGAVPDGRRDIKYARRELILARNSRSKESISTMCEALLGA